MRDVLIQSVRIDENGRIRVRPDPSVGRSSYELIYRAAAWVRWDEIHSEFYITAEKRESAIEQIDRISRVVASEWGDNLVVNNTTSLEGLPDEIISHISPGQR